MLRPQLPMDYIPASWGTISAVGERLTAFDLGGESFEAPAKEAEQVAKHFALTGSEWRYPVFVRPDPVPQSCHLTSQAMVKDAPERLSLVFGYSLSAVDGGLMWASHSFVFDRLTRTIIETTPNVRDVYTGSEYVLSEGWGAFTPAPPR